MWLRLKKWHSLDTYEHEEDWRVARVLLGLIFTYMFVTLFVFLMGVKWGGGKLTSALILGGTLQIIPLFLLSKGRLSSASFFMIGIHTLSLTIAVTLGQGIRDYGIMAYPVMIVFAGLAEKRRGLVVSTLLTFAALAWLVLGEKYGWFVVREIPEPTWFDLIVSAMIIVLAAFEVDMLVANLKDRLAQLNHELVERKQAEETLQQAHALLSRQMGEIEQLKSELQEKAIRDPLSGLYNRRYLSEILKRDLARMRREGISLSLLLLDLDDFKNINDTYGHPVGDLFLVAFARLLDEKTRVSDVVCRWGGEEFLILLPGTDLQAGLKYAEMIRNQCESLSISHDGVDLRVTVSIGVASYPLHAESPDALLIKADQALYQSKRKGKNRVTGFHS